MDQDLDNKIEEKRAKLHEADNYAELLEISQELDELIVEYMEKQNEEE